MAKIYGALEVAQLEWFTDAGKPAASQYAYRVIYLSDVKQVVVSDGTSWNPVNSRFTSSVDSASTGSSAAIPNGTNNLIAVTNASLSSIGSLAAPATGLICVLVNETGNSIRILDEDTSTVTAANRIRTGTGAPITVANNSAVYLIYVSNDSRWHIVGGVGSGSAGGTNFVTNGTAEADTTGWATYADAAAAAPVDGTGGVANITWTRSTSSPLVGTASFVFTKDAVNRQGQGASFDFTIDSAYRSKVLQISFEYAVSAGTFAAGTASTDSDITVWIYDKTNAVMIQPVTYKLFANGALSTTFNSYFQANPNSTSYRLILHVSTTSALAYDLKVDAVSVNPQIVTTGNIRGPVGSIIATGSLTPPMGYLYADGSAVSRTDYAYLFQAIGTTYGVGNGTTTFNLPDLRGIFARGAGTQTFGSITYSATLGTKQNDDFKSHFHPTNVGASTGSNWFYNAGATTLTGAVANGSTAVGGTETRPANLAVAYHICFDSGSVQMSDSIDYDKAEIGTVHAYAGLTAPTGFLLCDGTAVSRSLYSDLYAVIGTTYGVGDGSTTFNLPDTRGIFLRGAGTNPSNSANTTTIGTRQLDDFKSHTHTFNTWNGNTSAATNPFGTQSAVFQGTYGTNATGGTETRPANVGVNYIIRHAKRVVPSTIAASETVACYYDSGGTQVNIANNSIVTCTVFTNKIIDTHGAFSAGGTFTAPISGTYSVSGGFQFGINATGLRAFYAVGPTTTSILGYIAPSASVANMCNGSTLLKLNAGQQIIIKVYQNSGGLLANSSDLAGNYVCIVRVGN